MRQAVEDFVVPQIVEPVQRRLAAEQFDGVQGEVSRYPSEQQGHHQQHHKTKAGMQHRVLVEGAP